MADPVLEELKAGNVLARLEALEKAVKEKPKPAPKTSSKREKE